MSRIPIDGLAVCCAGLGLASILFAQPVGRPIPTIREGIDESRLVTLVNNTRPEATRRPTGISQSCREDFYWKISRSCCAAEDDRRSDEIGFVAAGLGHDGIGRLGG